MRRRWDREVDDEPERSLEDRECTFVCRACCEEVDIGEATTMSRHPEMPVVCLNCASGGGGVI